MTDNKTSSQQLYELGITHDTFSPVIITAEDFQRFPTVDHLLEVADKNHMSIDPIIVRIMKNSKINDIAGITKDRILGNHNDKSSLLFETQNDISKNNIRDFVEPNYLTELAIKAIKIYERIVSLRTDHNSEFGKELQDAQRKQKLFMGLSVWTASHSGNYKGELIIFNPFKREKIIKNIRYEYLNSYTVFRWPAEFDMIPKNTLFFGEY